jgi:membrane-associated phospholipid phosphatase
VLIAAPVATGTLGGLSLFQKEFPLWPHVRGWIHAHLVTEVATTFAKTTFLRERPYHDSEFKKTEREAFDNRLSFISGHASHTFAFATYSSALMWQYSNSKPLNWAFSSVLFAGATWVAAGRVQDHHHNPTDVTAGALVGTAVTYLMFERVVEVIKFDTERKSNKTSSSASATKVRLFPSFEGFSSQSKIAINAEARF